MKLTSVFASLLITFISSGFSLPDSLRAEAKSRFFQGRTERLKLRNKSRVDETKTLKVGNRIRSYIVHYPSGPGSGQKLPMVIVLHGGGGTAVGAVRMTGFNRIADKEGFIVVYPEGTGRGGPLHTWNAGNCCSYAQRHRVDDVSFIRDLIKTMKESYPIDSRRIYATGISNGGMMAFKLGVELSGQLAAIAPVAASFNVEGAVLADPVSVIMFNGTADNRVHYEGGVPSKKWGRRIDKPVSYAVGSWVELDNCVRKPENSVSAKGDVIVDYFGGGRDGSEVVLYTLKGSGHVWPGGVNYGPIAREPDPTGISASSLIWDFFSRHQKGQVE